MTPEEIMIQYKIKRIEAAFDEIKKRCKKNPHFNLSEVLKKHGLNLHVSKALYKLGIITGWGRAGKATNYEYLTHTKAREVYELSKTYRRDKENKSNKLRSSKLKKPVKQTVILSPDKGEKLRLMTLNLVAKQSELTDVTQKYKDLSKALTAARKNSAPNTVISFKLKVFGIPLWETIRKR